MKIYPCTGHEGNARQRFVRISDVHAEEGSVFDHHDGMAVVFDADATARITSAFRREGYVVAVEVESDLHELGVVSESTRLRVFGLFWDEDTWRLVRKVLSQLYGNLEGSFYEDYDAQGQEVFFDCNGSIREPETQS